MTKFNTKYCEFYITDKLARGEQLTTEEQAWLDKREREIEEYKKQQGWV